MPRRAKVTLTAAGVRTAKAGRYCDGAVTGLYLLVRDAEHKFWLLRYVFEGRSHEAGLGPAAGPDAITLAKARDKARALREVIRDGRDPLEEKAAARALRAAEAAKAKIAVVTFKDVAERYLRAHEDAWRNPKHRQQWRNTLRDYVHPAIGALPVANVGVAEVMTVVEPIWRTKPETAGRVRGRIEVILDFAKTRDLRDGENPARWKGHLQNLLPARGKVARVEHHAALPWRDIGAFMGRLTGVGGMGALALRFAILTAARSGEVRGARWSEIDLERGVWTVPPERMKAGVEHRVPMSGPALALLREVAPLRSSHDDFLFPGGRVGSPLSDVAVSKAAKAAGGDEITVHGFRSCFRDWVAEATAFPRELAEKALAHSLSDKVEAAYQRGDLFGKRSRLMAEWASFCERAAPLGGEVVALRREG